MVINSGGFTNKQTIIFRQAHVIPAGNALHVNSQLSASTLKTLQGHLIARRQLFLGVHQHSQIEPVAATGARFAPDHAAEAIQGGRKQILLALVKIRRRRRLHGFDLPLFAVTEHHFQNRARKPLEQGTGHGLQVWMFGLAKIGSDSYFMGSVPVIGGGIDFGG